MGVDRSSYLFANDSEDEVLSQDKAYTRGKYDK